MAVAEARRGGETRNDLLDRIRDDENFACVRDSLHDILNPDRYYGRAPDQVVEFVEGEIDPALSKYDLATDRDWEVKV